MSLKIQKTTKKVDVAYKSLYLKADLAEWLEKYASDHDTSFNNLVVSMIMQCKEEIDKENEN